MSGFFIVKKENLINKKKLYNNGFKILSDIIYSDDKLKIIDFEIKFRKRKIIKAK